MNFNSKCLNLSLRTKTQHFITTDAAGIEVFFLLQWISFVYNISENGESQSALCVL